MPNTRHAAAAPNLVPEPPAKRPRTRAPRHADGKSERQHPHKHRTDTDNNQDEEQGREDGIEQDQTPDSARAREFQKSQGTFRCPFSVPRQGVQYLCEAFGDNGRKTKGSIGSIVILSINS